MSTGGLFVVGVLVTLIVGSALALLVYAAVLDGRDEAKRKLARIDGNRRAPQTPLKEEQSLFERDGDPMVAA